MESCSRMGMPGDRKRVPSLRALWGSAVILVLTLMLGGCAKGGTSVKKHHGRKQHHTEVRVPSDISKERKDLVKAALKWEGVAYRYAGYDRSGTDCSGMVLTLYEQTANIKLPRNSAKQAEFCKKIRAKDVRPGDLVFFATGKDPDKISHVGIILNDRDFIHASSSKGVVISKLDAPYYQRTFKMFGRVPGMAN